MADKSDVYDNMMNLWAKTTEDALISNSFSHNVGNFSSSDVASDVASNVNITPAIWQSNQYNGGLTYPSFSYSSDSSNSNVQYKSEMYELKLCNGHTIMKKFCPNDIKSIEQRNRFKINFKKSFPFLGIVRMPYTKVEFNSPIESYDIDCDVNAFMKLINVEHKSFSKAILESAIANG